jgi:hypothetical protein
MANRKFIWLTSGTLRSHYRMIMEPVLSDNAESAIKYRGDSSAVRPPVRVRLLQMPRVEDMPENHGFVPIMSGDLIDLIASMDASSVEPIPVRLFRSDRRKITGAKDYFVCNVTRFVDCYDRDKSTVRALPFGAGVQITPYVIDPAMVPADTHIFRLSPGIPYLCISTELRDAIKKAKMVGPQFGKDINVFGLLHW